MNIDKRQGYFFMSTQVLDDLRNTDSLKEIFGRCVIISAVPISNTTIEYIGYSEAFEELTQEDLDKGIIPQYQWILKEVDKKLIFQEAISDRQAKKNIANPEKMSESILEDIVKAAK